MNDNTQVQKTEPSFTQMMTPKDDSRLAELATLAKAFAISGYFKDFDTTNVMRGASQALVKIMRGQDMGISPSASVESIYIIENRTAMSAHLMAALIRRSGAHFKIWEEGPEKCSITFYTDSSEEITIGSVIWTIEDARRANLLGKRVWQNYPSDMLYARAMSRGFRRFFSHLSMGEIYTPEELGHHVEDGRSMQEDITSSDVKSLESALDEAPLDEISSEELRELQLKDEQEEDDKITREWEEHDKKPVQPFTKEDDPVSHFESREATTTAYDPMPIEQKEEEREEQKNLTGYIHPAIEKLDELFESDQGKLNTVFHLTGVQTFDVLDIKDEVMDKVDSLLGRMYAKLTGKRNGPDRVARFLMLAMEQIEAGQEGWSLTNFAEIDTCISAFIQWERENA